MCPHGYHHSGSMETPALGTRDVRLHIVWIALWSHQSAQTASSQRCIVQKVKVPQGGSPPNPRECSNCTGSERNIQRITMCPHGYHHSGYMATPACLLVCLSVRYVLGRGDAANGDGELGQEKGGGRGGAMGRRDFFDGILG